MLTLRPYQQEAVHTLLNALAKGEHPVCSAATGAGKSLIIAELCRQLPGRILVATHRKELLAQNNAQLTRLLGQGESGIYSAGLARREAEARVIFGGIQSIYRRMEALQRSGDFAYVVVDECFPAGTLVDGKPIETVTVGEYVRTWNHAHGRIEYKKVVAISKRLSIDLLTITLSSGIQVICTASHPFWTGETYVPARDLRSGIPLYVVPYGPRGRCSTPLATQAMETERPDLLLQRARQAFPQQASLNATHGQQSHAQSGNTGQSIRNTTETRPSAHHAGGEWSRALQATTALDEFTPLWMGAGGSCQHHYPERREESIKHMVQNRYCPPWKQDSDRSRWPESSCVCCQGKGCEERSAPHELRVDHITSIERTCIEQPGGVPVYNLDVADNHNYFAENILVHNCHLVPDRLDEESDAPRSMYQQVFEACPEAQRLGLTATPYRLDGGPIYGASTSWFTTMPVTIGIAQLTDAGYLAPLVGIQAAKDIDLSSVRTRQGDYVVSDLSQVMSDEQRVRATVDEIRLLAAHRASWLCFCCDVAHTVAVTAEMQRRGILARMVVGSTPQEERDAVIAEFRAGRVQCLVNCQVATTGFDIPQIDAVILLRPTQSKSLLVQMLGRGTRLKPQGGDCVILDYADTLRFHLPLEEIPVLAKTPRVEKQEADEARQRALDDKEHARHRTSVIEDPFLAQREYQVEHVSYRLVAAKQRPGAQNLCVSYLCPARTPNKWVTIWLCPEYTGWPRIQAEAWFQRRDTTCPQSAHEAMRIAKSLPMPETIIVDERGNFPRILVEHMEETLCLSC